MKDWGRPFYFSFHHEPENDVLGATHGQAQCGTPDQYQAAFTRMQSVFSEVGVTNATWVITLMKTTFDGRNGGPDAWMPPDADYQVGLDLYNRASCASRPWQSFLDITRAAHRYSVSRGRRLFIGEYGCVEGYACGGDKGPGAKANWLRYALRTMKRWDNLEAACYSHVEAEGGPFWADSSPQALEAFAEMGTDPYFN